MMSQNSYLLRNLFLGKRSFQVASEVKRAAGPMHLRHGESSFPDQYCLTEKLHRLAQEGPEGARATHAAAQQPPCLVSAECYVTREVCSHPHLRPTDHGLEEKITGKKLSYTRLSFPQYSGGSTSGSLQFARS